MKEGNKVLVRVRTRAGAVERRKCPPKTLFYSWMAGRETGFYTKKCAESPYLSTIFPLFCWLLKTCSFCSHRMCYTDIVELLKKPIRFSPVRKVTGVFFCRA